MAVAVIAPLFGYLVERSGVDIDLGLLVIALGVVVGWEGTATFRTASAGSAGSCSRSADGSVSRDSIGSFVTIEPTTPVVVE
ncbi:hypothetical protein D8S78_10360 [Natrialba swarupiae]|nr:hypothetical protein [Natrialba swarupiae]